MKIKVKVKACGIAGTSPRWTCRLCTRTFKLPPDFPGDEKFESVCVDCVIVKVVDKVPYHRPGS